MTKIEQLKAAYAADIAGLIVELATRAEEVEGETE